MIRASYRETISGHVSDFRETHESLLLSRESGSEHSGRAIDSLRQHPDDEEIWPQRSPSTGAFAVLPGRQRLTSPATSVTRKTWPTSISKTAKDWPTVPAGTRLP